MAINRDVLRRLNVGVLGLADTLFVLVSKEGHDCARKKYSSARASVADFIL
jgi:hypothetical protein